MPERSDTRNVLVSRRSWRAWLLAPLFATASLAGVSGGCKSEPTEAEAEPRPAPDVLTERELVADPSLAADLHTTVALALERAGGASGAAGEADTGGAGVDVVPYVLPAPEKVRLCVEANGEADRVSLVSDDPDVAPLEAIAGGGCVTGELPAGRYEMRTTRDPASRDAAPKMLFVHPTEATEQCPASPPDVLDRKGSRWMLTHADPNGASPAAYVIGTYPPGPAPYAPAGERQGYGGLSSVPLDAYEPARGLEVVRNDGFIQMTGEPGEGLGWHPVKNLLLTLGPGPNLSVTDWVVHDGPGTPEAFLATSKRSVLGFGIGRPDKNIDYLTSSFELAPVPGAPWTFRPVVVVPAADKTVRFPVWAPPARRAITVGQATYGQNHGAPRGNVTNHLAAACDGRSTCTYTIDPRVIGDPAPGARKDYGAFWKCPGSERNELLYVLPEATGSRVTLSCERRPVRLWRSQSAIPDAEQLAVTFAMRWAPSPDLVGELAPGEVALYTGANFTGEVFVINDANAFPRDLTKVPLGVADPGGPMRMLGGRFLGGGGNVRSVRFGCDTFLQAYGVPDLRGSVIRSTSIDSPDSFAWSQGMASAFVGRTRQLLIETNKCTSCNLARVNLEGLHLEKVNLSNVDMSGARLAGASFDDGIFSSVSFDGADLAMTRFPRASFRDVALTNTDLTTTNLEGVTWKLIKGGPSAAPCEQPPEGTGYSRLAKTKFTLAQIPLSVWPYLDLSDARPDTSALGGTLAGKELCGLRLARIALESVDLTGTRFDRSDLSGASLAKSTGVETSFRFANLSGAHLEGVFLGSPDFTGATLVKSWFDESTITGSSTARVSFANGSGAGMSFTNATVKRARFGPAFSLVGWKAGGVSLSDVDLSGATIEGDNATFFGATFENVDLSSARLSNVAFNHTTFRAQSKLVGANVVQASFNSATFSDVDMTGLKGDAAQFVNATFSNVNLTNAEFLTNPVSKLSASFERAIFCGSTLSRTDFTGARLTNALFPKEAIDLPGAPPGNKDCLAVEVEGSPNPPTITSPTTTCPYGREPKDATCKGRDDEWKAPAPRRVACCVPIGDIECPPQKKPGRPCSTDCDCASEKCLQGTCAEF